MGAISIFSFFKRNNTLPLADKFAWQEKNAQNKIFFTFEEITFCSAPEPMQKTFVKEKGYVLSRCCVVVILRCPKTEVALTFRVLLLILSTFSLVTN